MLDARGHGYNRVLRHGRLFALKQARAVTMPKSNKKRQGAKRRPSWVAGKDKSLPTMTPTPAFNPHMTVRGIAEDEPFLVCPDLDKGEKPCINGSMCVARRDISGGPGYPLKQMLPSMQCILCLRREMKAKWVRHSVLEETVVTTRLCQKWESRVDVPGGYRSDCCIGPHGTQWNGFVSNVAVGVASDYTWVYEADSQQWRVDQSHLHFREALPKDPQFGGALSDS